MLSVIQRERSRQGGRNRRPNGGHANRYPRARPLHAARKQGTHTTLVHGAQELLTFQGLAHVLQANEERDDREHPHDPGTQNQRNLRRTGDRQDRQDGRNQDADNDRASPDVRVTPFKACRTREHGPLKTLMVGQRRHDLGQAIAIGRHTRLLCNE